MAWAVAAPVILIVVVLLWLVNRAILAPALRRASEEDAQAAEARLIRERLRAREEAEKKPEAAPLSPEDVDRALDELYGNEKD
jgi:flagellar biosynthesis/type III secretory pathway M-ring protein FliF/YscJ